jgi:hypothetical protein
LPNGVKKAGRSSGKLAKRKQAIEVERGGDLAGLFQHGRDPLQGVNLAQQGVDGTTSAFN